jgi:hypothetical protein
MSAMTWLAYIGPGVGPRELSLQAEWAILVALVAFAFLWEVLMRRERLSNGFCLGLATTAAIVVGNATYACLRLELPSFVAGQWGEWPVMLLALALLASAFAAAGALLLGLGRFLYDSEVPAAIQRAAQRAWPPGRL